MKTIDEYFLENNLNKSKFNRYQLEEINWGLKEKLDVSIYADPKYSDEQMNVFREELLKIKQRSNKYVRNQN